MPVHPHSGVWGTRGAWVLALRVVNIVTPQEPAQLGQGTPAGAVTPEKSKEPLPLLCSWGKSPAQASIRRTQEEGPDQDDPGLRPWLRRPWRGAGRHGSHSHRPGWHVIVHKSQTWGQGGDGSGGRPNGP